MSETTLLIKDLDVGIISEEKSDLILENVHCSVTSGEMHGLVGETGSGKSMTARSVVGLLPSGISVVSGSIFLQDKDLLELDEKELSQIRGKEIGMIFQNPRTALYPLATVESQITNILKTHLDISSEEIKEKILSILLEVGIDDPERVSRAFPHELSGGMAQRVVIACAIVCEPKFVIADEPTTGLDLTIQKQILDLISELQENLGLSILMITHDLGIVAQYCSSVTVLRSGRVVEQGLVDSVLVNPTEQYTNQLIESSRLDRLVKRDSNE
tara:strand:- start:1377 stop:2192 length:816 start_codon:yes stop_codon:yes gene_type:complete